MTQINLLTVGSRVALKSGSDYYLGTIVRETNAMFVVAGPIGFGKEKEQMFRKNPENKWSTNGGAAYGKCNPYDRIVPLTSETIKLIDDTVEKNKERAAKIAAVKAELVASAAAEKAWRETDEGKAQTAREVDFEGLTIVVDKQNSGYCKVVLVGPYQRRYDSEVSPMYQYADVYVRQEKTWGEREDDTTYVYRWKEVEITSQVRGSVARIRNYNKAVEIALSIASEWEKRTGQVAETFKG
jgi:hypothetical protein